MNSQGCLTCRRGFWTCTHAISMGCVQGGETPRADIPCTRTRTASISKNAGISLDATVFVRLLDAGSRVTGAGPARDTRNQAVSTDLSPTLGATPDMTASTELARKEDLSKLSKDITSDNFL